MFFKKKSEDTYFDKVEGKITGEEGEERKCVQQSHGWVVGLAGGSAYKLLVREYRATQEPAKR